MADDKKNTPLTLNQRVVIFAHGHLRKKVGKGQCWDLAELALKQAGALTSNDLGVVTAKSNYVWGTQIALKDIIPGDILEFPDKYSVEKTIETKSIFPDGTSVKVPEHERPMNRPHHTAIVNGKLDANGAVKTFEQHVIPLGEVVQNKTLYTRSVTLAPTQTIEKKFNPVTRRVETAKVTRTIIISVAGEIVAYRPQAK